MGATYSVKLLRTDTLNKFEIERIQDRILAKIITIGFGNITPGVYQLEEEAYFSVTQLETDTIIGIVKYRDKNILFRCSRDDSL
jgi:hypothetical protein